MIINFTNKHRFTTRIQLDGNSMEVVDQMKIIVTTRDNKLNWDTNTQNLIQKVKKQMFLLKKITNFGVSTIEMVDLWKIYCRSLLKQSAVVWGLSLTEQNRNDLERTLKSFAK